VIPKETLRAIRGDEGVQMSKRHQPRSCKPLGIPTGRAANNGPPNTREALDHV